MANLKVDSDKEDLMLKQSSTEVTSSSSEVTNSSPEVNNSSPEVTNGSPEVNNDEHKQPVMWKFKVMSVYMGIFILVKIILTMF